MGQQASQLERGDLDDIEDDQSTSQSPIGESRRYIKDEIESDSESPKPSPQHNTLSQDIAFSSQVPFSPSRNRNAFKTNRRTSASRFEISSPSPDPTFVKTEAETQEADQDRDNSASKLTQRKRGQSKKRRSLGQANDQEELPTGNEHTTADLRHLDSATFETQSSIDLEGVSSSPAIGQPLPTMDGDMTNAVDAEELRKQQKRERKERKKAKKAAAKQAEQLRTSLLAANPNFGAHDEPEALAEARLAQLQSDDVEKENPETRDSNGVSRVGSQRLGDPTRLNTEHAAAEDIHDTRMEDPNQLPTPDDETHPTLPPNVAFSQDDTTENAQSADAVAQSLPRKRKARDSDKKSRKKRKEQLQTSQEEPEASDEAVEHQDLENAANGTISSPTKQASIGAAANGSTSRIGDLAREFYSQRYASKNSTPSQANTTAASNKRLKLLELSPAHADDSPSAARLQRQAASARSSSERHVKQEHTQQDQDDADERMDIDAPPAEDEERIGDVIADASMADHDSDQAEPNNRNAVPRFGSDDLGVDSNMEQGENQVPESPPPQPSTKSKPLRQYGATASTSKKRSAKASYIDRTEEDNAQAFAELPSPAVVAASRKDKKRAKHASAPTGAGPSSGKQPKITSMMTDDSGVPSSAPEHPSNTSNPAPSFTARLPKRVTKMKNPKPEDEVVGPFTGHELRNLTEAIERWRVNHKLTDAEVKEMVQKNPQMAKTSEFWDYVHYACPNRKRQKIINQVRKTHHNFVARATWTKEQHDELAEYYEIHGKNYKLLGQLINRHPDDVRDRVRNYVICGDKRKIDAWTQEEEARLVGIINEAFDKIRELKGNGRPDLQQQDDEELVDWSVVSENMGWTRSRLQCRAKWKQLRLKMEGGNIDGKAGHSMEEIIQEARNDFEKMTHKDLYLIAKAIKRSGTNADSRIGWHKLRAKWWAMEKWNRPALMLAWHRLRRSVPDWRIMSVPEIAKHVMDTYDQTNQVHILPEDEMDLDAEYHDIEHKVSKMIKAANVPKSAQFASRSIDGDGADQQASVDLGEDDEQEDPDVDDVDLGARETEDLTAQELLNEASETQPQVETKPKRRRSSKKLHPTIEQSPEALPEGSSHDTPEPSSIPKKHANASRSAAKSRTKTANPRKNKPAKKPLSAEKVFDEDEVSSDTDADNMEDIPATIPE